MTLLEEMKTQAEAGSHVLSDLARSAMEKAPEVVEGTLDELGRDIPHAFAQARELVEQVATEAQERIAMDNPSEGGPLQKLVNHAVVGTFPRMDDARRYTNTGKPQAHGVVKRARGRGRGTPMKSSGHVWRGRVTFMVLGLGVGVIVNRALKARHRSEAVEAPTSSTPARSRESESNPYHTVNADSGGAGGVYHDREDCPAGKRILSEHRVSGTGGRDRCKECQNLAS
jgi:hypothetical protein